MHISMGANTHVSTSRILWASWSMRMSLSRDSTSLRRSCSWFSRYTRSCSLRGSISISILRMRASHASRAAFSFLYTACMWEFASSQLGTCRRVPFTWQCLPCTLRACESLHPSNCAYMVLSYSFGVTLLFTCMHTLHIQKKTQIYTHIDANSQSSSSQVFLWSFSKDSLAAFRCAPASCKREYMQIEWVRASSCVTRYNKYVLKYRHTEWLRVLVCVHTHINKGINMDMHTRIYLQELGELGDFVLGAVVRIRAICKN